MHLDLFMCVCVFVRVPGDTVAHCRPITAAQHHRTTPLCHRGVPRRAARRGACMLAMRCHAWGCAASYHGCPHAHTFAANACTWHTYDTHGAHNTHTHAHTRTA